jgi:hypothetical protein
MVLRSGRVGATVLTVETQEPMIISRRARHWRVQTGVTSAA